MFNAIDDRIMAILVGTYTSGESQGVYRLSLNLETGELTSFRVEIPSPVCLLPLPLLPIE